jgi:hypothetical protein
MQTGLVCVPPWPSMCAGSDVLFLRALTAEGRKFVDQPRERTINPRLPSSPPVMVDWNRPLTRVLTLKSGERLRTLHDAAELFTHRFGSVTKISAAGARDRPAAPRRTDRDASGPQGGHGPGGPGAALQHDAAVQHVM